jgi:CheY-like chemotaxis protein
MQNVRILWVDDEIDLLKGHMRFLEEKGFRVESVSNGVDALDLMHEKAYDILFLDEHMPGMDGLSVLAEVNKFAPQLPVVMITKSEEEHIMEDAIGSRIADYLIKPVKPMQILMACKKILENKKLINQKVNLGYQQDFRNIAMQFFDDNDHKDWADIYRKLVYWDLEMVKNEDKSMVEILTSQMSEANTNFGRYVSQNYLDWVNTENPDQRPLLSPDILPSAVFPHLDGGHESVFFLLVDCLRYDQWKMFEPIISEYFYINQEQTYYSILPTATQYARNSIFSGLHPLDISNRLSKYWLNDDEEGGKNQYEPELALDQITRRRLNIKHSYNKIITNEDGKSLADSVLNLMHNDLNLVVYNFIDLLSHSRTEMNIIRELAPNEAAYRSISRSWLEYSPLLEMLIKLSQKNVKVIITSDHGTIRVKRPVRIVGDRNTSTNLRYKLGKNLNYDENAKSVFTVRNPKDARLPQSNLSSSYAFTMEDYFFAYPNNYNYYVNYYRDTFQHGGISLEEMIIPIIELSPKRAG